MSEKQPTDLIPMGERGVALRSVEDLFRFSKLVVESRLAPRGLDTQAKVVVAVQLGAELGLAPMQALRCVYVTDGGTTGLRGDAALALVQRSGKMELLKERWSGEEGMDAWACSIWSRRVGGQEYSWSYSVADAKKAGLWGRQSAQGRPMPWTLHPKDMLYYRALGRVLRRLYSDVLHGLHLVEELDPERANGDPTAPAPKAEALPSMESVARALNLEPDPIFGVPALGERNSPVPGATYTTEISLEPVEGAFAPETADPGPEPVCPKCDGAGTVVDEKCLACGGTGFKP